MTLIDPRQYTPYELIFPSGNLGASQGEDYFNVYLLNNLTGDFNVTGSLTVNGTPVFSPGTTNNLGGTNNYVFGGTNNFVTGTNNGIIYAFSSQVSGEGNGILFGEQNKVVSGSYASILAGRNTLVSHTGAVVIGDSILARQKNSFRNDSLTIDLTGGLFNQYELFQKGNFYLDSSASGLVSGNWNFVGNVYKTGSPLQNLQNLRDASGTLLQYTKLNSGIYETGINSLSGFTTGSIKDVSGILNSKINLASGTISSGIVLNDYLTITGGTQYISGAKTFYQNVYFSGQAFLRTGRYIIAGSQVNGDGYITAGNDSSTGAAGGIYPQIVSKRGISFSIDYNNERNKNDKENQFTKNAFSVQSEGFNAGAGVLCFGVDGSGLVYARQGLIISNNRYVPAAYNSSGISGQMTWNPPYFYLCTGANAWGRVAVAPW